MRHREDMVLVLTNINTNKTESMPPPIWWAIITVSLKAGKDPLDLLAPQF